VKHHDMADQAQPVTRTADAPPTRYEVVEVRGDGSEVWHSCLDAVEFGDGRLAAEVIPGEVIFRRPGRWRKVSAPEKPSPQCAAARGDEGVVH
jgi:hypothetical protein